MKWLIANWKAQKTPLRPTEWVESFKKIYTPHPAVTIIICPSFLQIQEVSEALQGIEGVYVGGQDVSALPEGAFTGEVPATQIGIYAKYCIVGHSERRTNFKETNEIITEKIKLLNNAQITPIVCMRAETDLIETQGMIAYEPTEAISTGPVGKNVTLEKVIEMKKQLVKNNNIFLYGGNVNEITIKEYLSSEEIDGYLVGSASLNPEKFCTIISQLH